MAKNLKKSLTKPKPSEATVTPPGYPNFIADLKERVRTAQLKALFSINREMTILYWEIGRSIVEKQKQAKWNSKFTEKIAKDLQNEFPGVEGFSRTNLFRMKAFYLAYQTAPQGIHLEDLPVFNIPWGHNAILLEKIKDNDTRFWYAQKTLEKGWSRSMLEMWIESNLHKREGKALTNFQATLPKPHSDLAQQSMHDPYVMDFIMLTDEAKEREIEQGLMAHIQKFLIELGEGFAFIGKQVPLTVEGTTSYLDLLFYHTKLKCYIVVEIKAKEFNPRDTGQLNYYLGAVDSQLRQPEDRQTIGILLCKTKKKLMVEYAISQINRPISVSSYELIVKSLPKELKPSIPTIEQIEAELSSMKVTNTKKKKPSKPSAKNLTAKENKAALA
jgi:predicted nuclease of restriction endonuclease-like (RecB) superfamily